MNAVFSVLPPELCDAFNVTVFFCNKQSALLLSLIHFLALVSHVDFFYRMRPRRGHCPQLSQLELESKQQREGEKTEAIGLEKHNDVELAAKTSGLIDPQANSRKPQPRFLRRLWASWIDSSEQNWHFIEVSTNKNWAGLCCVITYCGKKIRETVRLPIVEEPRGTPI